MEQHVNIHEELSEVAPILVPIGRQMPNGLPQGYFDSLAGKILLTTAKTLQTFSVPEGYFETLPLEILIKATGGQPRQTVLEGYFESFADNMLAKVKALEAGEEQEELSPLFKSIGKKTPYSVPAGYFEQVAMPIQVPSIAPIAEKKVTPVVQMKPKQNYFAWAVAACSIGIISLITWQYAAQDTIPVKTAEIVKNTPQLDARDTSAATLELAAALATLEDNSLTNALNQTSATDADTHTAVFYLNTDNFENAVRNLSDEELEQYLLEPVAVGKKS